MPSFSFIFFCIKMSSRTPTAFSCALAALESSTSAENATSPAHRRALADLLLAQALALAEGESSSLSLDVIFIYLIKSILKMK